MRKKIKNMLSAAGMFGFLMMLTACGEPETEILWKETQAAQDGSIQRMEAGEALKAETLGDAVPVLTADTGGSVETGASDTGGPVETGASDGGAPEEPAVIVVDICGAVRNPGVYELREGDRIRDAVEQARGLTGDADLTAINQAEVLHDGMKIRVYTREETASMPAFQSASAVGTETGQGNALKEDLAEEGRVNINTADEKALISLSGIGPSRAADIIAYRTEHGPFRTKEEIMNVTGIKDATFNKIKDDIVAE